MSYKVLGKDGALHISKRLLELSNKENDVFGANNEFEMGIAIGKNIAYTHVAQIMKDLSNELVNE